VFASRFANGTETKKRMIIVMKMEMKETQKGEWGNNCPPGVETQRSVSEHH